MAIAATKNAIKLGAKIESLGKALRPGKRNSVWGTDVHELYIHKNDGTTMNVIIESGGRTACYLSSNRKRERGISSGIPL